MSNNDEFRPVLEAARRILDVYGRHETSDSPRVVYTEGDLNIGGENGIIDIFFRGSLVFRQALAGEATGFFEKHGVWIEEVRRIAQRAEREPESTEDATP